ncbi:MAG TPA: acyl-CoA dehydrogenase family protein, partial [Leptospiraceae bacterium]|nr:acyl-CoA dehydrogenase family protein [Leptospiraceae bacterium]
KDPRFEMAPSDLESAIDFYKSCLTSLGEFFGEEVFPFAKEIDHKGLKFENGKVIFPEELIQVYEKLKSTGLLPYSIARSGGGLGLPATIGALFAMIMARSDVSICMTVTLLNLAQIINRYGTKEQNEKYTVPAASGESLFAMALTEPDYGSDLNNVRTVATKMEDGSYRINGTKRFISQGCGLGSHPAFLLTLARTGTQKGARGLSVFLVKSSDVQVAGIEKKLGIHASPTCEIVYENSYAEILGEEGLGLTRYTTGMTNFMRLASAAGGPGGGAAALYECRKYAKERMQFGKPIEEIPAVSEMLNKIERETNAMRLITLETARVIDLYQHTQIRLEKSGKEDREIRKNERVQRYSALASILTPVAKYYCSEEGNKLAYLAIQIHGGVGYTEDFNVAKLYRDSRINSIYEGTSQIHVRIATGAIFAGMSEEGLFRKYLKELVANIDLPSDYLKEHTELLEKAILSFKQIPIDTEKERVAENLMILVARYFGSILYENSVQKLKGKPQFERWKKDARNYAIESTAIAHSCLFRIQNL